MSASNKTVVQRLFDEVWTSGNLDALDSLLTPDFIDHTIPPGMPNGRSGYRRLVTSFRNALPDLAFATEHLLAEGDRVAVHTTAQGTNHGPFMDFRPTHRPMRFSSISFFTFRSGQIAERFGISDVPALLMQHNAAVEENKKLVRDYFEEIWGKGNFDKEPQFVAQDIVVHAPPFPVPGGIAGPLQIVGTFRAAIPDLKLVHDLMFGDGDRVVHRYTVTGHHTGAELFGAKPAGAALEFTGINEFRIANGRIVERWGNLDVIRLSRQLGLG